MPDSAQYHRRMDEVLKGSDSPRAAALALTPAGTNSSDGPNVLDLEDDWGRKNPAALAKPSGETGPLADLELRMGKLESSALFTVVDEQHNPIFAVTPNSVLLYNSN